MNGVPGWMLTAGGLGYLRPASGTFGSLPPPLIALLVLVLAGGDARGGAAVTVTMIVLGALFAFACLHWGWWAEAWWGRKDPGRLVADEVAGQSLTLLFLPWHPVHSAGDLGRNALIALVAFLAFRICDIIKPPPARRLESLRGGAGILLDDLVAGLYAALLTQSIVRTMLA
ncbi:MAG: phosphatidylglycerophosphatase A [Phycisphaeraceae bacterium]|nr:phosphatidylglycerophosphatase A [Phycisphaeraceae bacterium]